VSDTRGATTSGFATVTVLPPPSLDTSVINYVKSMVDEAIASDDFGSALSEVLSTLSTFKALGRCPSIESF